MATYEQGVNLLPYMNIGLALPTVVVGLDIVDWAPIEKRYWEMYQIATANGVECHSFEVVRGTDDPTPPVPADPSPRRTKLRSQRGHELRQAIAHIALPELVDRPADLL